MKLKRFDDWGTIYYNTARAGISGGHASAANGIVLRSGMPVIVTWPDETRERHSLVARPHRQSINDMGHAYTVDSSIYGFDVEVHGVKTWIPIEDVDIKFIT